MIPTYRSLLIKYDPLKIAYDELLKLIESSNKDKNESTEEFRSKIYEIPVAMEENLAQI